jgi:hypothetical protein
MKTEWRCSVALDLASTTSLHRCSGGKHISPYIQQLFYVYTLSLKCSPFCASPYSRWYALHGRKWQGVFELFCFISNRITLYTRLSAWFGVTLEVESVNSTVKSACNGNRRCIALFRLTAYRQSCTVYLLSKSGDFCWLISRNAVWKEIIWTESDKYSGRP